MIKYFQIVIFALVAIVCSVLPSVAQQTDTKGYVMGDEFVNEVDSAGFDVSAPMYDEVTPKMYYIRKVNLHGVKYLNHSILKSSAGLQEGDSIYLPSSFIPNAMQRLWAPRYFSNIQIGATIEGDSLALEVFLKERPRILTWDFEGVTKSKKEDLHEVLKLRRNTELSDYIIDKNIKLIKEHYSEKGFRTCNVDVRIDNDTTYEQCVNVTFVIDRGPKVRVGAINFIGNEEFDDKRLRRTFKKTHQKSILFFQNRKLLEDEYEEDKLKLLDFYNSQGFRNANIVRDSIYFIDDVTLGIDIEVEEGSRFYVRDIKWVGNSIYETQRLESMLGIHKGDVYDKKSLHKRLGIGREMNPEEMSISSLYQNNGYLMQQIEPAEIVVGPDSLDLEIRIFEGKPFTVNNVGISGNMRVNDEVIRRELLLDPGDVFSGVRLDRSIRRLQNLGYFSDVSYTEIETMEENERDLIIEVEERGTGSVMVGFGYSSVDHLTGFFEISESNFDLFNWGNFRGAGQKARLSVSASSDNTDVEASFTEPWLFDRRLSLNVEGYYRTREYNEYDQVRAGGSIGIAKHIPWVGRVGLSYNLEQVSLDNFLEGEYYFADHPEKKFQYSDEDDKYMLGSLKLTWTFDTRNNSMIPTSGTRAVAFGKLYNSAFGSDYDMYEIDFNFRNYQSLPWGHVISLYAHAKVIDTFSDDDVVPIDIPFAFKLIAQV